MEILDFFFNLFLISHAFSVKKKNPEAAILNNHFLKYGLICEQ